MTPATPIYGGPTPEDLACIPAELTLRAQWVLWRGEEDLKPDGTVKLNKIPIDPQTLRNASTDDPTTWGGFAQCVAAFPVALEEWEHDNPSAYRGGGIGYVFAEEDPYTGIDLDRCVDPMTGAVTAAAQTQVDAFASYTERTPSTTGLHILTEGTVPPGHNRRETVEMYDHGRFFTMTGWHVPTTPATIEPRQPQLDALWCSLFAPGVGDTVYTVDAHGVITNDDGRPWVITAVETAPDGTPYACFAESPTGWRLAQCVPAPSSPDGQIVSPPLDDATLLAKAHAAQNGEKFAKLWQGDTSLHGGDDSRADMALCCQLAFWTQDPAQLDRLFRQSGLMRRKWNGKRGETTYGGMTITGALLRQKQHYQPAQGGHNGLAPEAPAFDLAAWRVALEARPAAERFSAVVAAMDQLALAPFATWMEAKTAIKALIPTCNLNDLERLRTTTLHARAARQHAEASAALPDWQKNLFRKKNGELYETEDNLQAIFANHPDWQGRLWWDVVAQRPYLDTDRPLDMYYVRNEVNPWLATEMRMPIYDGKRVLNVMRSCAYSVQRNPIQEWLATLPMTDTADPDRILLETWLQQYAGAEDTPYTRFVSRMLVVSLVKRALDPGCQYRYVVVLEGKENLGKTQLLRLLGSRWHQEFPKSVEGKESYMQLQGYWLVELGELDALKPAQESRIKMFISQQMDVWVPKFENDPTERPRRAILVGTTNEREYLKGEHGNTRYLPVWLDGPVQLDAIATIRDWLFTQAKHFLADHPTDWWRIPAEVEPEVLLARKARQEPSVYADEIATFLYGKTECTLAEVYTYLGIAKPDWKRLEGEVAKGLRGWTGIDTIPTTPRPRSGSASGVTRKGSHAATRRRRRRRCPFEGTCTTSVPPPYHLSKYVVLPLFY
jgi:hypothetical protein